MDLGDSSQDRGELDAVDISFDFGGTGDPDNVMDLTAGLEQSGQQQPASGQEEADPLMPNLSAFLEKRQVKVTVETPAAAGAATAEASSASIAPASAADDTKQQEEQDFEDDAPVTTAQKVEEDEDEFEFEAPAKTEMTNQASGPIIAPSAAPRERKEAVTSSEVKRTFKDMQTVTMTTAEHVVKTTILSGEALKGNGSEDDIPSAPEGLSLKDTMAYPPAQQALPILSTSHSIPSSTKPCVITSTVGPSTLASHSAASNTLVPLTVGDTVKQTSCVTEDSTVISSTTVHYTSTSSSSTSETVLTSRSHQGTGSAPKDTEAGKANPLGDAEFDFALPTHKTEPITTTQMNGLINSGKYMVSRDAEDEDASEDDGAMKAAEAEWDQVQTITPGFSGASQGRSKPGQMMAGDVPITPLTSYAELSQHIHEADYIKQLTPQIRTSVQRRGFSALKHLLFGTKLHGNLHRERDMVFCAAQCQLMREVPIHSHVLNTIFRRLTGSKFDPPRFGSHWEQIGFQGNDPATDLRGCGLLGLMQLSYLLSDANTYCLAADIYKLSLHETQNFPFCLMSINITRIVIQALREDCLNKECNKRKHVLSLLNEFYIATFLQLYTIWKTQHKTIKDTGFVIKDVEEFAKKKPNVLLKNWEVYLIEKRHNNDKAPSGPPLVLDVNASGGKVTFTQLDDD